MDSNTEDSMQGEEDWPGEIPVEVLIDDGAKASVRSNVCGLVSTSLERRRLMTTEEPGAEQGDTDGVYCHLRKKKRPVVERREHYVVNKASEESEGFPGGSVSREKPLTRTHSLHEDSGQARRNGVRQNMCDICGKQFSRLDHYKRHLRTHTGELPFKCRTCQYKSHRADHLKRHMLRSHGELVSHRELITRALKQQPSPSSEQPVVTQSGASVQCKKERVVECRDNVIDLVSEESDGCPDDLNSREGLFSMVDNWQDSGQVGWNGDKQNMCNICDKQFSRLDHYKRHLRTHTGELPFECRSCEYKSHRADHLKRHMMRNHGELVSHRELITRALKQQAVATIENPGITRSAPSGEPLHFHQDISMDVTNREDINDVDTTKLEPASDDHSGSSVDSNSFDASASSTIISSKSCHKSSGQAANVEKQQLKCSLCDKEFRRLDHYERHVRTHTGEKPFACNVCDYKSSSADHMKKHIRNHASDKSYACDLCEYKTSEFSNLKEHVVGTHISAFFAPRDEPEQVAQTNGASRSHYKCSDCDKGFSRLDHYKRHMSLHVVETPHECSECDFKSSRADRLRKHMRIHTNEKPYACDVCDYRGSRPANLAQHMRTHTRVKPHACDVCDYRCGDVGSLKKHLMIHTGEKPYACTVCDYKCSQPQHLRRHIRSHTGERPYACDRCDYKCGDVSTLQKHKRTHTGEKRYACDVCDYKCTHGIYLRNHKIKVHGYEHTS